MSDIATRVKEIIVDKLGVDENKVKYESRFTDDLGADSLDAVELIMEMEKEFKIAISDDLMEKGIALAKSNWDQTKSLIGKTDWIITHQVGVAHEMALLKSLSLTNQKTFSTYPELGNTGSCALPITLMKLAETNQIKKGEILGLLGIGSGLSSLMLGLKW